MYSHYKNLTNQKRPFPHAKTKHESKLEIIHDRLDFILLAGSDVCHMFLIEISINKLNKLNKHEIESTNCGTFGILFYPTYFEGVNVAQPELKARCNVKRYVLYSNSVKGMML